MTDHRALIEEARQRHLDGIDHIKSTWGAWCYCCQVEYPCLPARLADALETALRQCAYEAANANRFEQRLSAINHGAPNNIHCRCSVMWGLEQEARAAAERRAAELERGVQHGLEDLAAEGREVAALRSHLAALLDRLTLTEEVLAECRAWHCSGHRRCELERGHAGDHFTTSLGNKFGGWDDSASVDVPRLLSDREAASRSHREMFERQADAVRHHTDRADTAARRAAELEQRLADTEQVARYVVEPYAALNIAIRERDEQLTTIARDLAAAEKTRDEYQAEFSSSVDLLHQCERERDELRAAIDAAWATTQAALAPSPQEVPQRTVAGSQAVLEAEDERSGVRAPEEK